MHRHCGTNNRAPRWTFTDPCKPEVRPGAREESASPAWLAAPAMNARDTTKMYKWRLDTGCGPILYRKRHSHNTPGKRHNSTWVEPLAGSIGRTHPWASNRNLIKFGYVDSAEAYHRERSLVMIWRKPVSTLMMLLVIFKTTAYRTTNRLLQTRLAGYHLKSDSPKNQLHWRNLSLISHQDGRYVSQQTRLLNVFTRATCIFGTRKPIKPSGIVSDARGNWLNIDIFSFSKYITLW